MAHQWSINSFLSLALMCCLAAKEAEAQVKYPPYPGPPQNPQTPSKPYPSNPQNPAVPPFYPQNPSYPPQTPPVMPPFYPQNPSYPPQTPPVMPPPYPKKPGYPPQTPPVMPPPYPKKPGYPPQTPPVMPPTYPQKPSYPPQNPSLPKPPNGPPQKWYSQTPQASIHSDAPKTPTQPKPQTPEIPAPKNCEVETSARVPCGVGDITAEQCTARDCCFDGQACYFAKGVTVQCTKDGQFIVVVAKDVTLPHIDLESISLLGDGQGCSHVDSNSIFAIYFFPVTSCGSIVTEEPGAIIYENRMSSTYEVAVGPNGAITRDSTYELLFQCKYHGTSVETLLVEVLNLDTPPLPVAGLGPIRVHLKLGNGQCSSKGCDEVQAAYTSYYLDSDYPVPKVLRDPVYVEVELLEKTDPQLVLTLGRCWTTTSPNPHSLPQWDILIDGCPYADDRYLSSLVPVDSSSGLEFPTHHRRFIFKMFTFVNPTSMEPLKEKIYIHCSTAVCVTAPGGTCEPSCSRKGKRDTEAAAQRSVEPKIVVSSGELVMTGVQE